MRAHKRGIVNQCKSGDENTTANYVSNFLALFKSEVEKENEKNKRIQHPKERHKDEERGNKV